MSKYLDYDGLNYYTSKFKPSLAELIDGGAKNIYKITNVPTVSGVTIAKTDDSTVSINGTFSASTFVFFTLSGNNVRLPAGEYVVATEITGTIPARTLGITSDVVSVVLGSNAEFTLSEEKTIGLYVQFLSNDAPNGTIRIMICKKSDYQVSNKVVPYRPSYEDIVEQVEENETNISNIINSDGQYNIFNTNFGNATQLTVTFTENSDKTVTVNGTPDGNVAWIVIGQTTIKDTGDYYVSGCPSGGSWTTNQKTYRQRIAVNGAWRADDIGSGATISVTAGDIVDMQINIGTGYTVTNMLFKPMITKKEYKGIPYQPYALPNSELTASIVEVVDNGAKNLSEWGGGTATTDGSFVVQNQPITLKGGTYAVAFNTTANSGRCEIVFRDSNNTTVGSYTFDNSSTSTLSAEITLTADAIKFNIFSTKAATISNFMICTKATWDTSHTYQPYALPNTVITPSLIELVDEGAKNIIDVGVPRTETVTDVVFTINSDGTVNASTTATTAAERILWFYNDKTKMPDGIEAGKTYCFYCNSGTSNFGIDVWNSTNGTSWNSHFVANVGTYLVATIPTNSVGLGIRLLVPSGVTLDNVKAYPMICTKVAWDISHAYVPHRKDLAELTVDTDEDRASLVELVDNGAKNLIEFDEIGTTNTHGSTFETNGVRFTLNNDMSVSFERISASTSTANCWLLLNTALLDVSAFCDGKHILSGCPSGGTSSTYEMMATISGGSYTKRDYGNGVILDSVSGISPYIQLTVRSGFTGTATFKPMVCSKASWDISTAYAPYALPNTVITPGLIELVDSGAKNLFNPLTNQATSPYHTTADSAEGGTVTTTSNGSWARVAYPVTLKAGQYTYSGNVTATQGTNVIRFSTTSSGSEGTIIAEGISISGIGKISRDFTLNNDATIYIIYCANYSSTSATNTFTIAKNMICTKAAWGVSHAYQPYRPSYQELAERTTVYTVESSLFSYADTLTEGMHFARQNAGTGTDKPVSGNRYMYQIYVYNSYFATITAYEGQRTNAPVMYIANKENGTWGSWYKFEGTVVT